MFKFLTKKKRKFSAHCALSKLPVDRSSCYMLTTAQIISSKKFWDSVMTEPETLSYTEAYFKDRDSTAENIRNMIFNKYSAEDKAWVISDSHEHLFEVDWDQARNWAESWWDSEGACVPDITTNSLEVLGGENIQQMKDYAVKRAGGSYIKTLQ